MGANIHVDGAIAVVEGVKELNGAPVRAHDLRAGAAMVIAGLAAKGVTEVEQVQNIERGYETLVEKFVALGAGYVSLRDSGKRREQVISNCNEEKRRREHPFAFFARI